MITGKKANILIIDDSSHYAGLLGAPLVDAGYKVSYAHDKNAAMLAIKSVAHVLDIVVVDLDMPEGAGLAVLEWVKENNPGRRLPVICLIDTANEDVNASYMQAGYGVEAVLRKDITVEKFLAVVNAALCPERRRVKRQERVYRSMPVKFMLGTTFHDGVILNMGEGGVFLHTNMKITPDMRLRLRFMLIDGVDITRSMMPAGTVRWATPESSCKSRFSGVGIQFTQLVPSEERMIKEFVGEAYGATKQ